MTDHRTRPGPQPANRIADTLDEQLARPLAGIAAANIRNLEAVDAAETQRHRAEVMGDDAALGIAWAAEDDAVALWFAHRRDTAHDLMHALRIAAADADCLRQLRGLLREILGLPQEAVHGRR